MKTNSNFKNKTALVIGAGSIGTDHISNLSLLGFEISVLEIDKKKEQYLIDKYKVKNFFTQKKKLKIYYLI